MIGIQDHDGSAATKREVVRSGIAEANGKRAQESGGRLRIVRIDDRDHRLRGLSPDDRHDARLRRKAERLVQGLERARRLMLSEAISELPWMAQQRHVGLSRSPTTDTTRNHPHLAKSDEPLERWAIGMYALAALSNGEMAKIYTVKSSV